MFKVIFPLACLLGLLGCYKTEQGPNSPVYIDQFVFGRHATFCEQDCSIFYRLTTDEIFADDCNYCYPGISFRLEPLGNEKFQIAQPLLDSMPAVLLLMPDAVFGCPGCLDDNVYQLRITRNGITHTFRWGGFMTEVPNELRPYFEKVMQTVQDLQ